jgi:hypothetical protein
MLEVYGQVLVNNNNELRGWEDALILVDHLLNRVCAGVCRYVHIDSAFPSFHLYRAAFS